MGRSCNRLTARSVATISAPGRHPDGGGLHLQVGASGARSWIFRFMLAGRSREMGLGPTDAVTLAEARSAAAAARKLLAQGKDPIEVREAERRAAAIEAAKAMTFKACAERCIEAQRAGWKNAKHAAQWGATLDAYAYPVIGDLPVQGVDTGLVLKIIEPIWTTKPETASRVRGRIESVLNWATAREYRAGDNPARWRGHLDKLLPARSKVRRVEHHAALPYDQIGAFMAELRAIEAVSAWALELTILTAARSGEVLGARWDEIDTAKAMWVVPAERMKAGREHRVPLSPAALTVLDRVRPLAHEGGFVFPGLRSGRPVSGMSMLMLLRRMGRPGLTAHGFRSSFRDWAAERTNFPSHAAEMALAHTVSDKVEAAYRRGDLFEKRRRLMEAWAEFCSRPAPHRSEIVPMQRA
ncbi:MAG: integrase arm-type DNA-binding domain-containing protein [Alphaproteobacteria bacterium]|nr:integrase arm-type DNA-binding domain-containing protein [Alphaproteobacteria bacterium]MBF0394335.1 integrase arm-type DNA-binding domain-containing protein [Alphaproteobacteria bacterium]